MNYESTEAYNKRNEYLTFYPVRNFRVRADPRDICILGMAPLANRMRDSQACE